MHAEELLQAHTAWCQGTALLRLTGELDLATAPLVDQTVNACLAKCPRCLYLDLTNLTFCDGTGLQALRRVTDAIHATDTAFCLIGIHPNLHRTMAHFEAAPPWPPPDAPGKPAPQDHAS
ncbi:STAS domain-containing protein [Streptomyces chartreusis]|uniref:STAS domain-containing protein n=1 Tax=Streptomyces chartreusis TaxID=1969 RepID=UPI00369C2529